MKLVHKNINKQFDFKTNLFCHLIVENPKEFFMLTKELHSQTELGEPGDWVLSDSEILDVSKNCLFIYDYYQLNFNSKKIQNIINSSVLNILKHNDYYKEFSKINLELIELNQKVLENIELPIQYNNDFNFEDFVKFSNYTIGEETNFLQKIISFIDIYSKLKSIKLIIFINLFLVLSKEEINLLIKQLKYQNLSAFFITSGNSYNYKFPIRPNKKCSINKNNINCQNKNKLILVKSKTRIINKKTLNSVREINKQNNSLIDERFYKVNKVNKFIEKDLERNIKSCPNEKINIYSKNYVSFKDINLMQKSFYKINHFDDKQREIFNKKIEENIYEDLPDIDTTVIDDDLCLI